MIQIVALGARIDARISSFSKVKTLPARGTLITATTYAGFAKRRTLLTAPLIVSEKASRTLGHTHPEGARGKNGNKGK